MADYKVTKIDKDYDFSQVDCWDVVIIGSGPAGLAAGLTTAHRGLTTLIIEAKEEAGGQPQFFYPDKKIVDIPGYPDGITGAELSEKLYQQAQNAMVQFRFNEELCRIDDTDELVKGDLIKTVVTTNSQYSCRKVILAMGLLHQQRKLPVLDDLGAKKQVLYRMKKAKDYEGKHVVVIGGGDSALDAAIMAIERNAEVTLLVRREPSGKQSSINRIQECGGDIYLGTSVEAAHLEGEKVVMELTNGKTIIADVVVIQIGFLSAKGLFKDLKVTTKSDGSIAIDAYYETSRKGIFAVGDIHGDIKLVTVAWAEGIQAAVYAFKEISSPYWINEKRLKDKKIAITGAKIAEAATTLDS